MTPDAALAILQSKLEICQQALYQSVEDVNNHLGQLAAAVNLQLAILQSKENGYDTKALLEVQHLLSELISGLQHMANNNQIISIFDQEIAEGIQTCINNYWVHTSTVVTFKKIGFSGRVNDDQKIIFYRFWYELMQHLLHIQHARYIHMVMLFQPGRALLKIYSNEPVAFSRELEELAIRASLFHIHIISDKKNAFDPEIYISLELDTSIL